MDIKQFGSNAAGSSALNPAGPAKTGAHAVSDGRRAEAPRSQAAVEAGNERSSKVELSEEAQTVKGIMERLADLPAVDSNRVQRLKAAIDEGRYQASPERIADKLLNRDGRKQES